MSSMVENNLQPINTSKKYPIWLSCLKFFHIFSDINFSGFFTQKKDSFGSGIDCALKKRIIS